MLNFKGLPHKTEWIEYPDITPTFIAMGMPQTGKRKIYYSVPAISDGITQVDSKDHTPTLIADSWKIAHYLETKYPGPYSLFPNDTAPMQYILFDTIEDIYMVGPSFNLMVLQTFKGLNPTSHTYFRETREERPGLCTDERPRLEDLCPEGPERDAMIEKLERLFTRLDDIFAHTRGRESEGIFTLPSQIVYSDFCLAAILMWFKVLAYEELWVHIEKWNGGRWATFFDAIDSKYGQVV